MTIMSRVRSLVRNLFMRERVERDLDAEIGSYVEHLVAERVASGESPDAARRAALLELGGHDQVKEATRDARAGATFDRLLADFRYAIRGLSRSPGFTVTALLALSLGIAITTSAFSLVYGVLLRPLPYPEPHELHRLWMYNPIQGIDRDIVSYPQFLEWRERSRSFEHIVGVRSMTMNLTGEGDPEELRGQAVTEGFFDMYGIRPVLGRVLTSEEASPDGPPAVMLSHALWSTRFGSDPTVVGRTIRLNDEAIDVIGVMPPDFGDIQSGRHVIPAQFWVPLKFSSPQSPTRLAWGALWLPVLGRLRDGVTMEQAQSDMSRVARDIEEEYPQVAGSGVLLESLHDSMVGNSRTQLVLLLSAAVLVLMIACANIANLMLARSASRTAELSVRVALGAGRLALVRQVVVEGLVIGIAGGVIGTAIAWFGSEAVVRLAGSSIPRLTSVEIDARVLGASILISMLATVLFALAPAFAVSRQSISNSLRRTQRSAVRGSAGMRPALVAAQFALALVLLYGTGLLVRSFANLLGGERGFDPTNVLVVDINLPSARYADGTPRREFHDRLLTQVRMAPGVESADVISTLMLSRLRNSAPITVENRPAASEVEANLPVAYDAMTPGLIATLRMQLLSGRTFDGQDGPNAPPVAIVNETFVRRFLGDEDPLTRRFTFGSQDDNAAWLSIVGVVRDAERESPGEPTMPYIFLPYSQMAPSRMQLVVRTQGDPLLAMPHVRDAVRAIDPLQPISMVRTLDQDLAEQLAPRRFVLLLLAAFASVAVVLAGIGIYGVISYAVNQRTREFGLRMALGAEPRGVLLLVMRQAGRPVLAGMLLGSAGAFASTRLLRSQLFGISGLDAMTQATVVAMLVIVAVVAVLVPALRATGSDPLTALRAD